MGIFGNDRVVFKNPSTPRIKISRLYLRKSWQVYSRGENTPIPTQSLRRIFKLILQEFAFGFNGKNYLQTHGTAMGTKMAVAFANIFMSVGETEILNFSKTKPLEWERYIDDIFSL